MARIDEIAPDMYRVSLYVPQFDLQFNHFLIKDEEPLLFHTGMRRMFPEVRDAVARLIDPATLRWISWSHFEVDECGALNEWLAAAPRAQAICSQVGAAVNIEDFATRPPRGLGRGEVIETGRHTYRFVPTPHLPHGWDAGVLFEEKAGVLLCSDLFHQLCDVEPVTSEDVLGRWERRRRGLPAASGADGLRAADASHAAPSERARRSAATGAGGHARIDVRRGRRGRRPPGRGRYAAVPARRRAR
jgi:flavorubredoxin